MAIKHKKNPSNFNSIKIDLASPTKIKEWSHGEVVKPETINYRTQRSERGGLFDERIFGPEKDYECYCGKYKRIRYKGIICEKCGVEITRSVVRRERMGHIELASPVSHIWFLRGIPSRIGRILDIPVAEIEKVIYFAGYIITKVNQNEKAHIFKKLDAEYKLKTKDLKDDKSKIRMRELLQETKKEIESIAPGKVLDEVLYYKYSLKYGTVFEAGIGAEAIYDIFKTIDLKKLEKELEERLEKAGAAVRIKVNKRLSLIRSMISSNLRPEWMFLTVIPIIPPALRPMVALEGGRHATSDVNDLYRRVINRNNRLKKLIGISAPGVILRNEKRILQEAVDALLDNSIRRLHSAAMSQEQRRPLKSLSDNLKGKQGLFRQNLLGKRVDYSGRSVIVVGPDLKLNQCGIPKRMALELFRPFIVAEIIEKEMAFNIRGAGRLIDEGVDEVWKILEEVIDGKYVLLNRAPTLHRMGIQAFNPVLIEGSAIQVHPLVCAAFNADFDGDQMAVHVPLSKKAQDEAREIMASNKNLLGPGTGDPIVKPSHDIVLGCYWMTKIIEGSTGEDKFFSSPNSAITAYNFLALDLRARVKIFATNTARYKDFDKNLFETTVGRLLFNSVLPEDFPFINETVDRKVLATVVEDVINKYGVDTAAVVLDKIKELGFKYVTRSGITWGIDDVIVPKEKKSIIKIARKEVDEINEQYEDGLLAEKERYRKTIEVWQEAKSSIGKIIPEILDKNGSVYTMVESGARGSWSQIAQMAGMKGLIVNTAGRTIDFPVIPSSKEGLSPLEYFITTHGARKGLADTALQTAKAGYLTRRLVDVAQDAIIIDADCKEKLGRRITATEVDGTSVPYTKSVRGRVLSKDVIDRNGKKLFTKGHILSKKDSQEIEDNDIEEVWVRSVLTCKSIHGICRICYGLDLGRNKLVKQGEAVGIVAAQAIGEPGTQLTMRTFHAGGVASVGGDITMGLPRVEEIFERGNPKSPAVVATEDGEVISVEETEKDKKITVLSKTGGSKKSNEVEYLFSMKRISLVKSGDSIKKGQIITDGSANMQELFKYGGINTTQGYIIDQVSRIYELQGASIALKHIEVIVRQMFSRCKIKEARDTKFTPGEVVQLSVFTEENIRVAGEGKEIAEAETLVMGISKVALTTDSWLSAASFENTTRILIDAALRGAVDSLRGLKENVMIGRLIPAGSGFEGEIEEEKEVDTPPSEGEK